jgi:O-methyltransferase involved in polyketide biosynthesis
MLDDGPGSLAQVARRHLDPERGTAIITEGLTNYFDRDSLEGMWRRFAAVLAGFPHGVHYCDLFVEGDAAGRSVRVFARLLGAAVRGRIHLHFADAGEALAAVQGAGFTDVTLHSPPDFADTLDLPGGRRAPLVRVVEARTAAAARTS